MKKTLLTAVSALAIMGAAPAFADNVTNDTAQPVSKERAAEMQRDNAVVTEGEMEQGWEDTKQAVSDAADSVSNAANDAYISVKDAMTTDETAEIQSIKMQTTAEGIIGEPVYNEKNERVAKVHDIILDRDGKAVMVVLADGDFTGLGKLVAYDYSMLTTSTPEGDVMAPLTEEMIDQAASFSYDREEYSEDVRVIPSNGYSVATLLDGTLTSPSGEELAEIDNITMDNGSAESLLVGFGQTLGMGGEQALVAFSDTNLRVDQDNAKFQLSDTGTTQFKTFKDRMMNQ